MISCAFDVDSVYLARPNSGPGLFDFHANVYMRRIYIACNQEYLSSTPTPIDA